MTIRSRAATEEYRRNFETVKWGELPPEVAENVHYVRALPGGGWSCGEHEHDTFAEAARCIEGGS